jgi:DNA-binding MurR/RpiR family transcriptional regulator
VTPVAEITERIERGYAGLSPRLRKAARYAVGSPAEIALYSLREVAMRAKVGPTTFVRLAERLGFQSDNTFRESFREGMRSGPDRYARAAEELRSSSAAGGFGSLYRDTNELIGANLAATFNSITASDIAAAGRIVKKARRVYILGLRSNYSLAFYLHYVLRTFMPNVILLEDRMDMLIDELGGIGAKDALIAFSYEPYAITAVKAVQHAAGIGAAVIAFTGNALSPIARDATKVLVAPNASTSFYQSVVPTMALLESLICYLATHGGASMVERVKTEFERRERFGVYWRDGE